MSELGYQIAAMILSRFEAEDAARRDWLDAHINEPDRYRRRNRPTTPEAKAARMAGIERYRIECARRRLAARGIQVRTDEQRRYDREYQSRKRRQAATAGAMDDT